MTTTGDVHYDPKGEFDVQVKEVEYLRHADTSWLALIYQPQGPGPFPALLSIHGGAWSSGDRTRGKLINEALAASGVVVVSIDLPLSPAYPYPAQVLHANYATRWLKLNAHEFNASPEAVGDMGMSSGGHAVMLSAMLPRDPRYNAIPMGDDIEIDATLDYILLRYPVLDPYFRYTYAKETGLDRLVNATEGYFRDEASMHEGNPQEILERQESATLPPTLLVQGSADENVPLSIPERFTTSYRRSGGLIECVILPDVPHAFDHQPGPDTDHVLGLLKHFIARQLDEREKIGS